MFANKFIMTGLLSLVLVVSGKKNKKNKLDAKDLELRRDLLDVATTYFEGIREMAIRTGDEATFIQFAYDTLTEDFTFPSDISGVTYSGLDEYLDPVNGFYPAIIGGWDQVTTIVGSNIIYRVISDDTVEMELTVRSKIGRDDCPQPNGSLLQLIIEEEINVITLVQQSNKEWKISSVVSQDGGRFLDLQFCDPPETTTTTEAP